MKLHAAIPGMMLATLVGCCDTDSLRAQGTVSLTVRQAGERDGTAGFTLAEDTTLDAPPGAGVGFYGTCVRIGNRWTVDLGRADPSVVGLRRVVLSGTEGGVSTGLSTKFALGTTEFSGTSECTASALSLSDKGLRFSATCTGMRASGDPRTVDASVSLTFTNCNVQ